MLKIFPIDFIRQILEQTLYKEHLNNEYFFGGYDQVNIASFYEQLKGQDEVDRFVETYRDLSDQQNRTGLILNGVVLAPENPTITNLYSSLIVPLTWTCSLRCTLANRDQAIETINNLISELKGRKVDIAQLKCIDENGHYCYKPFVVGTIGENDEKPSLENGDYIGIVESNIGIVERLSTIFDALELTNSNAKYVYCENDGKIKVVDISKGGQFEPIETTVLTYETDRNDYIRNVYVKLRGPFQSSSFLTPLLNINDATVKYNFDNDTSALVECSTEITRYELVSGYPEVVVKLTPKRLFKDDDLEDIELENYELYLKDFNFVEDDGTYPDIVFPPEHESFEKYKVSLSFDAIRCDEPRTLNAEEYCELSFGGSATLVNEKVKLGNDLIKIKVSKDKIVIANDNAQNITFGQNEWYLEPLETPSGLNANTNPNQLVSNLFKTNTHTDAIALTIQYTFVIDETKEILSQWFDYGRYGTQGITIKDISPNMIYEITEYWSSWGVYSPKTFKAKLVENVDIENTESDTMTLSLTFQIQGENN